MKKYLIILTALAIALVIGLVIYGCEHETPADDFDDPTYSNIDMSGYERYRGTFFDTFDTVIFVVGYTKSEAEFNQYMNQIEKRFQELHKLYDIYNTYPGINNVKSINDKAGIEPVKVDKQIIDLIEFSKVWHTKTKGKTNIALGPVTKIWHDYREEGSYNPAIAKIPPMADLLEANKYTDINKVIVDKVNSTVYLEDKNMRLDVGAVAKGYATELVAQEMYAAGFTSMMMSAGGNVRALDRPMDPTMIYWGVGIQDPNKISILAEENLLDTIFITNQSVVSSGDYERYYIAEGELLHHIIDSDTLMPPHHFRQVTIITEDSAAADFLSTVFYTIPYEEGKKLAKELGGIELIWVMPDGSMKYTDGAAKIMKSKGATKDKPIK